MDYSWKSIKGELEKAAYGLGPEIGTSVRAADEALRVLSNFARAVDLADTGSPGNYRPDETLPRDKYGNPIPESSEPYTAR